jgi:hypothetical protein
VEHSGQGLDTGKIFEYDNRLKQIIIPGGSMD